MRARDGSIRAYALVDPEDFDWLSRWRWSLSTEGYAVRGEYGSGGRDVTVRMHRNILGLARGDPREGDHVNRDRLDNRRSNLRIVDRRLQKHNVSSHRGGTSRFRGVWWDSRERKWFAEAHVDGRKVLLGRYQDERQAADVARRFRLEHMARRRGLSS